MLDSRTGQIGIIGDCSVDLTFVLGQDAGEKVEPLQRLRSVGGTGANAAAAAVRLGSSVRLASVVGDDPFGSWVRDAVPKLGLEASLFRTIPGSTELAVVLLGPGGRRVIVDPGVGYNLRGFQPSVFSNWADVVYLTHTGPELVRLFTAGTTVPVIVGLNERDLESGSWDDVLGENVIAVTSAPNEPALRQIAHGPKVITQGPAGAILVQGRNELKIPAPRVEVVDATGAGDCLAGALCHFLAGGRLLEQALTLAVIAASLSTRGLGANGALPSEALVLATAAGQLTI